jgi:signal transduction histidine kinase
LEKNSHSGQHLLTLVSQVLDLSKIEAGKMVVDKQPMQFVRFMKSLEQMIQPQMAKQQNHFSLDYPKTLYEIDIDENKLKQILLNLLSNAAKFTQHGTVNLSVRHQINSGIGFMVKKLITVTCQNMLILRKNSRSAKLVLLVQDNRLINFLITYFYTLNIRMKCNNFA